MRLRKIYTRFYRSLNYDYLRASHENYTPDPWDTTPNGSDYPFVSLMLEPDTTTIVGANESGKSQILRAIKAALNGTGYDRSDFCRYSPYFGDGAEMVLPEFGAIFTDITPDDVKVISEMTGATDIGDPTRFALFRMNSAYRLRAYVETSGVWSEAYQVKKPTLIEKLRMPAITEIDADVPLPNSIPWDFLIGDTPDKALSRDFVTSIIDRFKTHSGLFANETTIQGSAAAIAANFSPANIVETPDPATLQQYKLGADLLFKVARIEREQIAELANAVKNKNGYASSLVDTLNDKIARALNFPKWWSQDSHFELVVSALDFDLQFEIRDRTGKSYSFDERSDGLKYYLSYFVQYLAHERADDTRPEVLLMDEPDRFLSSSAQQDLLRIFEDFAHPQDPERKPVQVVYVTHSPFLIDKNDARRIRVLEKGEYDEGTRVVRSVAANHYEPLRSAFGSFVAETTFISGCNLVVEGPSDQVLLAGATRWLKTVKVASRDRLDLNAITIVPAGGTEHVPYMVYLARGRDVEKPAIVALLDSDKPGDKARQDLQTRGNNGKPVMDDRFVLQIGEAINADAVDNPCGAIAIEDLLPLNIAIDAAARYCREFVPAVDVHGLNLTQAMVFGEDGSDAGVKGLLDALQSAIAAAAKVDDFHLDKIAFARAVTEILAGEDDDTGTRVTTAADLTTAQQNFGTLLSRLAYLQRESVRAGDVDQISSRINRIKREFTRTQKGAARREDVLNLIEQIEAQLDYSAEADEVLKTLASWRSRFKLHEDPQDEIDDYAELQKAITSLAYQAVRNSQTDATSSA
ncbi:AAA family ATPase [Nocardioides carbamazepini]|uniref:AAA family ATPase n=1 Tax=Nocardioides carbamazepini TaxID=2854259 RepID=UPI0021499AB1|nr:AAA family ATPase [Nocardioides carbamazepini]MCR1781264.1 AAA family ATPase [Nocardioides carbamazepini]